MNTRPFSRSTARTSTFLDDGGSCWKLQSRICTILRARRNLLITDGHKRERELAKLEKVREKRISFQVCSKSLDLPWFPDMLGVIVDKVQIHTDDEV